MNTINNQEYLKKVLTLPSFTSLFPKDIFPHIELIHFQAGETVIEQGKNSDYLYFLINGKCIIREYLPNGKSIILNTVNQENLIGEIELVDQNDLSLSVSALIDSNVVAIPLNECKDILLSNLIFLKELATILAKKERYASKKLVRSYGYPLKNRLANFILENKQGDWFTIKKVEIAESLGVSYRHVENLMYDFIKNGYLEHCKPDYLITNLQAIKQLANEYNI